MQPGRGFESSRLSRIRPNLDGRDTMASLSETSEAELSPPIARARPGGRLGALAEMVLCSGFLSQLVLSILVQALGIGHEGASGKLSLEFVAAVSLSDTVLVMCLMVWFTRRRGERPSALWLGHRPVLHEARIGLLSAPFLLLTVGAILGILQRVAPHLHNVTENPLEAIARVSFAQAVGLGVVAVVAGAVREELQRAFLQDRFERHFGPPAAGVVVLSTLFGLGHVLQGWDAVIATAALGAVWASIDVARRSVVMPLVGHACFNSLEIIRMLASR
jgi:membrane protease YdiL (CAAX protease family)